MQAIQDSKDKQAERAAIRKQETAAKGELKLHPHPEVSDDDSYSEDDAEADAALQPPHPQLGQIGKSSSKMALEAYLAAREAAYQVGLRACLRSFVLSVLVVSSDRHVIPQAKMAEREQTLRRKSDEEAARLAKANILERVQHNRAAREMAEIEAIEDVHLTAQEHVAEPASPDTSAGGRERTESEQRWYEQEQQRKRDEAAMEAAWNEDDDDDEHPKPTAEQKWRMRLERQSVAVAPASETRSRNDSNARYRAEEEQRRRDEAAMEAAWTIEEDHEHDEHDDRGMLAMPSLKSVSVKGPSVAQRYIQAVQHTHEDPKHHHNTADD
jgi:hypothetical protein